MLIKTLTINITISSDYLAMKGAMWIFDPEIAPIRKTKKLLVQIITSSQAFLVGKVAKVMESEEPAIFKVNDM